MLRAWLPILAILATGLYSASLHAGTSNSLMDLTPDGNLLIVANTDNGTVTLVDTAARKAVREIPVGQQPEGTTWIGTGPLAAVTLYRDGTVAIVDTQAGKVLQRIKVAPEPYGIVASKDGSRAWVTHEYPGLVSEIDLKSNKVLREIPGGAFLRGIAVDAAEKRLYVTEFYTGVLNAIDLAEGKIVDTWKGHATDNLARNVILHPKRAKAYVPHIRSMVHVNHGAGSIFPSLAFIDPKPGEGKRRIAFGMDTFNGVYVVTNPWEAAISPDGKRFYLIYAGTNDMNFCNVIDDDYREIESIGSSGSAIRIGQNPRAIRVSPDGKTVYIYNFLDNAIGLYSGETMRPAGPAIKVCEPAKSPEWFRGKILFNTANPPLTSRRWIACSSCHPDGHTDARVWQQPEGLRKTTALLGMAHTHPLHWSADRDEAQDFEFTLRSPLMQGKGLLAGTLPSKNVVEKGALDYVTSGKSKDLDAMAIYCNSFEFPLSPHIAAPGKLTPGAERGKAIFSRKEVGCTECHSGPYYTDSTLTKPYKLHDVGTGREDKTEKMGTLFDTPTLLGIYRTAPYLHDGKAKTLHEVLTTCNQGDKHGKTSHLKPAEIDDLVAFLKALPYETPSSVTPNTVPFRFVAGKKE